VDRTIKTLSRLGRYVITTVAGEPVKAFVPPPLPPVDLDLSGLHLQLERANQALGHLAVHPRLFDILCFVSSQLR